MRIVLDTNILISATMWDNSVSNKLLRILAEKDIEFFTSYDILEEYRKVLRRDFKYEEESINKIILELLSYIQVIEPQRKIEIVKGDPDDNKIIECALESGSDYILTYDKHLLTLEEFEEIKILKPEDFLDRNLFK
jgi:putative PIN family toxin of toxin-antitoxin system